MRRCFKWEITDIFAKHQSPLRVTLWGTGTSTGVPVIGCRCKVCTSVDLRNKRLRASALIEIGHTRFVIDTGPDFRAQMLSLGSPEIAAILYTHIHADHVHGFDDLRSLSFQTSSPVRCYLAQDFMEELRRTFSYAFTDTGYTGAKPNIDLRPLPESGTFTIDDIEIETARVPHGHVMTSIFRFGSFAYATDFKYFQPELIERWKGKIHTLVASGIYFGVHSAHSTIEETLQLFDQLKVKRGVITHISHRVDYEETMKQMPAHVELGYDGMLLTLP